MFGAFGNPRNQRPIANWPTSEVRIRPWRSGSSASRAQWHGSARSRLPSQPVELPPRWAPRVCEARVQRQPQVRRPCRHRQTRNVWRERRWRVCSCRASRQHVLNVNNLKNEADMNAASYLPDKLGLVVNPNAISTYPGFKPNVAATHKEPQPPRHGVAGICNRAPAQPEAHP